jgi:hypothetical protein
MSGAARRFGAEAHGSLIGSDAWTGEVLTVHAGVVNILRADELVVSLVADSGSMTGMSVRVPTYFDDPFEDVMPGWKVARKGPLIDIADVAQFDLSQSRPWEGTINKAVVSDISMGRVLLVRDALIKHGKAGGLLDILAPGKSTSPFVEKARKALSALRLEDLVGLGPGLTPAGDDFLAGAMMSSTRLQGRTRIRAALSGTTPGGRTLLWMAVRRSFPAYLIAFAEMIAHPVPTEGINGAVRAACSHGETSGTDCLAGFCWASLCTA